MRKTKLFSTIVIIFYFVLTINAQTDKDPSVIAKIGNKKITASEFKERFELTPQVGIHGQSDLPQQKEKFLYSLVAEKLWALDAENKGFDTTGVMRFTFPALEKMYLRDALYSKEIKSKVKINPADYPEYTRRAGYNIYTRYLFTGDKDKIHSYFKELNSGASFDSVFNSIPSDTSNYYFVQFAKMDKDVEDSLYKLKQGQFTSPIKSPNGWYIFYADSLAMNLYTNDSQISNRDMSVRKTVEARAIDEVYQNYYRKFFKDYHVTTDGELFWSFSNYVIGLLNQHLANMDTSEVKKGRIALRDADLSIIENKLGPDSLNMPFVKFTERPVPFKDFLHSFFFEGFYTSTLDPFVIRGQLKSRVKYFIEQEMLTREALNQGLQNDPGVKYYRQMWRDSYLAALYKQNELKDIRVTDEEAFAKYNNNNKSIIYPKQVNILEILTDSLEVIEKALNDLDNGADFRTLAKQHTKRSWTKDKGGEFGLFPTTSHGEIGKIAGEMNVGEVYGPVKTDEGYSLFKLIDKKESEEEIPKPFNEVKDELKAQIGAQKLRAKFVDQTAQLAAKYGITVDENALKSIDVDQLAMVVYRYMGFGGKLLAVPFTNLFYDWVEKWKINKLSLP